MKTIKVLKIALFWGVIAISFIMIAILLVVSAVGYRVNYENLSLQKTAILAIKTLPKDAIVYINGKALDNKTPIRLTGLTPNFYELKIEKSGYTAWQKSVQVEGGFAYDFDNVVLFLQDPLIEKVSNPLPEGIAAAVPDKDLLIDDGEIWYKDELVTRLSQNILNAIVYPDKNHIVFQVRDEIKVVEINGGNNTLLVKLTNPSKTVFGFQDSDILLFQDGDIVKQARIL